MFLIRQVLSQAFHILTKPGALPTAYQLDLLQREHDVRYWVYMLENYGKCMQIDANSLWITELLIALLIANLYKRTQKSQKNMRTAKPCPNRRCQSRAKAKVTKGMNRYEHPVSSWMVADGCRWSLHVGSSSPGPVAPSPRHPVLLWILGHCANVLHGSAQCSHLFGLFWHLTHEEHGELIGKIHRWFEQIINQSSNHITPIHVVQLSINIMQDPCSSCSNELSLFPELEHQPRCHSLCGERSSVLLGLRRSVICTE